MRKYLLTLVILLATGVLAAQIRVDVRLVNVVATVTDSRGRYVEGLRASDFTLEEDGIRQEITHFSNSNDLPVSVGIVLDSSTSMERKIGTASRAVERFIRGIHEDDDIFLMTFDDSVRVRQDFTSDRDKLSRALDKVKLASGTALYDGVIEGVRKVQKGMHPKKALLLISDGVDVSSGHDFNVARLAVRESEVLVYAMGIAPDPGIRGPMTERTPPIIINPGGRQPGRIPVPQPGTGSPFPIPLPGPGRRHFPSGNDIDTVDMNVLDTLAFESGGKSWLITPDTRRNRLQDAMDEIADELRNQYSLGYYPSHDLDDGKWHHIELRLRNPEYSIRYKQDYRGK